MGYMWMGTKKTCDENLMLNATTVCKVRGINVVAIDINTDLMLLARSREPPPMSPNPG